VNPVAATLPGVQQRALQLAGDGTSLGDGADAWSQLITSTGDSLSALGNEIAADPFPVLTQLGSNLSGYAETIGTSLQDSFDGMERVIAGDPSDPERLPGLLETLQTVSADLQDGNYSDAYAAYDVFSLEALKFVFKPLTPILGIPDEMVQDFADLSHEFFTADDDTVYYTLKDAAYALLSPPISAFFELSNSLDSIDSPQDLFDMPARVLNAFLNGYTYPGQDEPFAGLLTDGGPVDYLLVSLPQEIAGALDASASEPAEALGASVAELTSAPDVADTVLGGF
jgi:hypothetical protein